MSPPRLSSIPASVLALVFVTGAAAAAYGVWARPLLDAERELDAGRDDAALHAYASAEARFGRFGATRQLAAPDYARAVANQLALMYRAGRYEAVVEKASTAPAAASPHFWAGSALLARALAERAPEPRLVWLTRAEDELKQALRAAPDDWDSKVNYEIAARLLADLRREPTKRSGDPMMILRPQPGPTTPVRKAG